MLRPAWRSSFRLRRLDMRGSRCLSSDRDAKHDTVPRREALATPVSGRSPSWELFESMPVELVFPQPSKTYMSTFEAWKWLISAAKESLNICTFYWNLRDAAYPDYPTSDQGRAIFDSLIEAAKRGVQIRIVQNRPMPKFPQADLQFLTDEGHAKVVSVDMKPITGRNGVMHTKFLTADKKHFCFGSPNLDWKSLTEVKEIGILVRACPQAADDLDRMFEVYWRVGQRQRGQARQVVDWHHANRPLHLPLSLDTEYNSDTPFHLRYNNNSAERDLRMFFASSPVQLNTPSRENDLFAILRTIDLAREHVRIQVMDYLPALLFHGNRNRYWSVLDSAIRSAAYRGQRVELLVSQWEYSRPEIIAHLRSLLCLNDAIPTFTNSDGVQRRGRITVKLFSVPPSSNEPKVDHTRVNHNKFLVTEKMAYIGTSNWTGDYFTSTAGVGMVVDGRGRVTDHPTTGMALVNELNGIFLRDWNSPFAAELHL